MSELCTEINMRYIWIKKSVQETLKILIIETKVIMWYLVMYLINDKVTISEYNYYSWYICKRELNNFNYLI